VSIQSFYVGILPDGRMVQGGATPESAVREVEATGFSGKIVVDEVPPSENPANLQKLVDTAIRRSGLRPIRKEQVMSLTPEQAVERLRPIMGLLGTQWTRKGPGVWADELMGDNSKLVKDTTNPGSPVSLVTERPGYLIGLNLFPADKLLKTLPVRYPDHPLTSLVVRGASGDLLSDTSVPKVIRENLVRAFRDTKQWSLCAGSSPFCRNSCLVFTGKNALGNENDWKKSALALAMIGDPVAYFRLLVLALERGVKRAAELDTVFFVRMNLLSDVPWEEFVPWLFKMFPTVQFYDYTKVFGRDPRKKGIKNYDLTFSFSGTNASLVTDALYRKNRRVAVVFLGHKKVGGRIETYRRIPETGTPPAPFGWGLVQETDIFAPPELKGTRAGMRRVVTADSHDARPLDPPNRLQKQAVIAGLIWKTPMGAPLKEAASLEGSAFVTKTYFIPTKRVRGQKRGEHEGRFVMREEADIEGFFVVAETPRYEGLGDIAATLTLKE
jgi:hypothetical protein